jgi:hypothetical protein
VWGGILGLALRLLRYRHTKFAQLLLRRFVVRLEPQCLGKMRYGFLSMAHACQQGAHSEMSLSGVSINSQRFIKLLERLVCVSNRGRQSEVERYCCWRFSTRTR